MKLNGILSVALAASTALAACSSGGGSKPTVKVGSDGFYEAKLMAEIYAQALEANGWTVNRDGIGIGGRKVTAPALEVASADEDTSTAAAIPTSADPSVMPLASPPFAPIGIFTYDWRDKEVVPPVAVAQSVSGWWGSMGEPPAGTPLGAIDVVVDETGRVVDARIYRSANRVYDAVLLESVKQWRYRPATKDGRPVKYRRVTGVLSGR